MPKLEEIWARKKEASAQVSAQTRTLEQFLSSYIRASEMGLK